MYKTELHCHSKGVSPCGKVDINDIIEKYVRAGYKTLVLTNHFSMASYKHTGAVDYSDFVERFFCEAEQMARLAEGRLTVLCGAELRLSGNRNSNEFLIYGADRGFFLDCPNIFEMNNAELYDYAHGRGALVIQAHPCRPGMEVVPIDYLDGYEVFNGHPGHQSDNARAEETASGAKGKAVIRTSGTDFHRAHAPLDAGIITELPIKSMGQLIGVLRSGDYKMIKNHEAMEAARATY